MHSHRTPDVPLWDHYRALREQWTHEDHLVNHRTMWLIVAQGLLFNAHGARMTQEVSWLVLGFPAFGMLVAALIGVGIFTALAATDEIKKQFEQAGLSGLCSLAPPSHIAQRGRWAAKALPFVFGALWLLALASSLSR
jgi:hypothetical protein